MEGVNAESTFTIAWHFERVPKSLAKQKVYYLLPGHTSLATICEVLQFSILKIKGEIYHYYSISHYSIGEISVICLPTFLHMGETYLPCPSGSQLLLVGHQNQLS